MDAKKYLFIWLDHRYGGSPSLDDWSNSEVLQFAEDYKSGKFLNGETLESNKEFCDCSNIDYVYSDGIKVMCSKCGKPLSQNSLERT